jgi:hypothetical protein
MSGIQQHEVALQPVKRVDQLHKAQLLGVWGPHKAPRSCGVNSAKSCILALSWTLIWHLENTILMSGIQIHNFSGERH